VMTPRPEIIWVGQGITIEQFLALYSENYHTRFPVYRETMDNVVGLLAVKDVMRLLANGAALTSPATSRVRPLVFVPETKKIQDLFDEMRASGEQIAMVADEYGGVAGLVTLKRLVEDIVGRVGGEDEVPPVNVVEINAWTFDLGASISIADLNTRLELAIPEGDYETLAGFLLEELGNVPDIGDQLEYANLRFTITEMQGVRISGVRVESVPLTE
jgi:putative hemolysin